MGFDEGNLKVINVDLILESCPITIVILNLLVYNSTIQYSTMAIIVYDSMYVCMYGHTCSKSMGQLSKVANPARGQLKKEKIIFSWPRSRLRI